MPKDGDKNSLEPVGGDMRTWKKTANPKQTQKNTYRPKASEKKSLTQQNLHSRVFVGLACWFGTFQKGLVLDP